MMPVKLLKKLKAMDPQAGKLGDIDMFEAATSDFRPVESQHYSYFTANKYVNVSVPSREEVQSVIDVLREKFKFVCETCHQVVQGLVGQTMACMDDDEQNMRLGQELTAANQAVLTSCTTKPGILLVAFNEMGEIVGVPKRGLARRTGQVAVTVCKDGTLTLGNTRNLTSAQTSIATCLVRQINEVKSSMGGGDGDAGGGGGTLALPPPEQEPAAAVSASASLLSLLEEDGEAWDLGPIPKAGAKAKAGGKNKKKKGKSKSKGAKPPPPPPSQA
jgi:hypothetical protein